MIKDEQKNSTQASGPISEQEFVIIFADDMQQYRVMMEKKILPTCFPKATKLVVDNGIKAANSHKNSPNKNGMIVLMDFNMRPPSIKLSDDKEERRQAALENFKMNGLGSALAMRKYERENKRTPAIIFLFSASIGSLEDTVIYFIEELLKFIKDGGNLLDLRDYFSGNKHWFGIIIDSFVQVFNAVCDDNFHKHGDTVEHRVRVVEDLVKKIDISSLFTEEIINDSSIKEQCDSLKSWCQNMLGPAFDGYIKDKLLTVSILRANLGSFFNAGGKLKSRSEIYKKSSEAARIQQKPRAVYESKSESKSESESESESETESASITESESESESEDKNSDNNTKNDRTSYQLR